MNRTRQELIDGLQQECFQNGFALSVARSDQKRKTFQLQCDKGGSYRNRGKFTDRKTGSIKTNCPFKYFCAFDDTTDSYIVTKRLGEHNHPISEAIITHPVARRYSLKANQKSDTVATLISSGVKASKVMTVVRKETGSDDIIAKDIYNLEAKERKKVLNGRTP